MRDVLNIMFTEFLYLQNYQIPLSPKVDNFCESGNLQIRKLWKLY